MRNRWYIHNSVSQYCIYHNIEFHMVFFLIHKSDFKRFILSYIIILYWYLIVCNSFTYYINVIFIWIPHFKGSLFERRIYNPIWLISRRYFIIIVLSLWYLTRCTRIHRIKDEQSSLGWETAVFCVKLYKKRDLKSQD